MSPKFKQAFSLFVSTTVVLGQTSVPTFATNNSIDTGIVQDSLSQDDAIDDTIIENITNEDTIIENVTDEDTITEDVMVDNIETISELAEEGIIPYAAARNSQIVYTHITKGNSDRTGCPL